MNGLIRKLGMKLGVGWLTKQVRAAAEGKLGPRWEGVYWALVGKKRWLSLGFAVVSGTLAGLGYTHAAEGAVFLAGLFLSWGFVDKNWRDESETDWLKDSAAWKFLAHNSPTITAGLALALAWLQGDTCTAGEWCARGSAAVVVAGALLAQVGIVDAAWNAPAPK